MLNERDVVAIAVDEWRAMGLVEADRTALADDLRMELRAAVADGATPEQLIGPDIRVFARRLAEEAGARRVPYEFRRLLLAALAGAAPGAVVGWLRLWYLPIFPNDPTPSTVVILAMYAGLALPVLAGALVGAAIGLRGRPAVGGTVARMALLVPLAGLLATPLTMGFAWLVGYSTLTPIVLMEVGIVAAFLAGATVIARRWALAATGAAAATPSEPVHA
ncbi:hypothetical protein K1W54_38540 [Micromonospora sp. CPCC 205371]|nr:hypothetical protein [Micromonospora sp. CPCC 205371]